jgi:thymidylate synthase
MKQYLDLLRDVRANGSSRPTRAKLQSTGKTVNAISVFGRQVRFPLRDSFPMVTTKRLAWKAIVVELLWFIRGESNTRFLKEHNVTIWDEWERDGGEVGPIYGVQWRRWPKKDGSTVDQLGNAIESIKKDPFGRRHIVSAWNAAQVPEMALPPCHVLYQFYVSLDGRLSCHLYQRSADIFLGVPFNIASYALLTYMVAHLCDLKPDELVMSFGDLHLYENCVEQADLQLTREPFPLPTLEIKRPVKSIDDFKLEDIELKGYQYHPSIKAEVAV